MPTGIALILLPRKGAILANPLKTRFLQLLAAFPHFIWVDLWALRGSHLGGPQPQLPQRTPTSRHYSLARTQHQPRLPHRQINLYRTPTGRRKRRTALTHSPVLGRRTRNVNGAQRESENGNGWKAGLESLLIGILDTSQAPSLRLSQNTLSRAALLNFTAERHRADPSSRTRRRQLRWFKTPVKSYKSNQGFTHPAAHEITPV